MKRAALIFLLILLVSIQTPVGQLFKLPLLIEHFIKHHNKNGVSLTGFLSDHYAAEHKDADFPEDEQLPFKTIIIYNIGYCIVSPAIQAATDLTVTVEKKAIFPELYTPQQHLASIFHPPRV